MYDPIYSQNIGLCGFRCRVVDSAGKACTKVVRTYRGITMHCKRVHGLVAQMKLFDEVKDGKETEASRSELQPVRSAAERAVLIANGEGLPFTGRSEDS